MSAVVHIVDDDASFRTSTGRLLRACGYAVETYESAEQLLKRLPDDAGPGCILLDVKIPGVSGPELQDRLNALGSSLPDHFSDRACRHPNDGACHQGRRGGPPDEAGRQGQVGPSNRARSRPRPQRCGKSIEQLDVLRTLVSHLTPRERQVFERVVRGKMNKEIARELGATERTIKAHRHHVMEKVQAASLAELVIIAERLGILAGEEDSRQIRTATGQGTAKKPRNLGVRVGLAGRSVGLSDIDRANRKLIIVLDDDTSVLGRQRVLTAHDFDAEIFNTVESFLGSARVREASCLVLDINLNGTCGIELSRLRRSGVSVPVIFITGVENEATRKAALEEGCLAYLAKPFSSDVLIEVIEKIGRCKIGG